MLDIKFIRENAQKVQQAAKDKNFDLDVEALLALDTRRREIIQETEHARSQRNDISSKIPKASSEERPALIAQGKQIRDSIALLDQELQTVMSAYDAMMLRVPGVPLDEVPVGAGEEDCVILRHEGSVPEFDFEPRDHEELGQILGILDKDRGIKVGGARSYLLRGAGAKLEMAVIRLAMDMLQNYELVLGPVMVNESALIDSGFFPYGQEDTYQLEREDKYLIGTSEVVLVSMVSNEIIDEDQLPLRFMGYSPCFRREAGSAGRDTRGVYRVHQFSKVEQVIVCKDDAELSRTLHDELLGNSERLLQALEIPYRVSLQCTGEIGLGQVLKHDLESWMPSRDSYGETHSCSSLYDYQARRAKIRYRGEDGKIRFCYTLNNTMVASPRILIPILENYQQADGSVVVPKVLRPYMNGLEVIEPK